MDRAEVGKKAGFHRVIPASRKQALRVLWQEFESEDPIRMASMLLAEPAAQRKHARLGRLIINPHLQLGGGEGTFEQA